MSDPEVSPDCSPNPFQFATQSNGCGPQAKYNSIVDQEGASSLKPSYLRKRKQPAEIKIAKGGPLSPAVSSMRKTQSVHDLVHEGKLICTAST